MITLNTYHRTGGGIAMYKIVVDSCGELPEELKKDGHFETVSLELEVDGYRIKDDETFNQKEFLVSLFQKVLRLLTEDMYSSFQSM